MNSDVHDDDRHDTDMPDIAVSLTAKTKARYFTEPELCRRVLERDGTLFWSPVEELYLLRTERTTTHRGRVVIKFIVEDDTITVINQTSDHYDWAAMVSASWDDVKERANIQDESEGSA